jgi:hypothetical protein
MKVSWNDDSQYIMDKHKMFQTTNQYIYIYTYMIIQIYVFIK